MPDDDKINDFDFYKSIYDRELKRRVDLDGLVTQPMTASTLTFALLYFIVDKSGFGIDSVFAVILIIFLCLAFIAWGVGIYYIALASNNFLRGFDYKEPPFVDELYEYQQKYTEDEDSNIAKLKYKNFRDYIVQKFVSCSNSYMRYNDKRSLFLRNSKSAIIITLFLELIASIIYLFKAYHT